MKIITCFKLMILQTLFYLGYIICGNSMHGLFPEAPAEELNACLHWAEFFFGCYAALSFCVVWVSIRSCKGSLQRIMQAVNFYHLVLFALSFAMELLLQYAYFKGISFAIQSLVLLFLVNLAALALFWIAGHRKIWKRQKG